MPIRFIESVYFFSRNFTAIFKLIFVFSTLSFINSYFFGEIIQANKENQLVVNNSAIPFLFLFYPILFGAKAQLFANIINAKSNSTAYYYYQGFKHWGSLFLVLSSTYIAVFMGSLLVFPGIYIFIRLSFAPYIAALEQKNSIDSLRTSILLTQPEQLSIFTMWMLSLISTLGLSVIISVLTLNILGENHTSRFIATLANNLISTLPSIVLFRFYALSIEKKETEE